MTDGNKLTDKCGILTIPNPVDSIYEESTGVLAIVCSEFF